MAINTHKTFDRIIPSHTRILITLNTPHIHTDGKEYKGIYGPAIVSYENNVSERFNTTIFLVGSDENRRIAIPLSNIASFVECNKVLKNESVLVLE